MRRRMIVMATVSLLATACAGGQPSPADTPSPSGTPSSAAATGNGSMYIGPTRYPIDSSGALGTPNPVYEETGTDDSGLTGLVDGRGELALTGVFTDYYTTRLEVRDAATGTIARTVDVDKWCGGEGGEWKACILLDGSRVLRTDPLWAGAPPVTIRVSSLETGQDLAELGSFARVRDVMATTSPDWVMVLVADEPASDAPTGDEAPVPGGTVQLLDLTTGATTRVGTYPQAWDPVCTVGSTGVIGYRRGARAGESPYGLVGVGDVTVPEITEVEDAGFPVGCSADGAFVYVPRGADGPTALRRVSMVDGSSTDVLELAPGVAEFHATR